MEVHKLPSFMDFYEEVERQLKLLGSDIDPDMDQVAELQEDRYSADEIALMYVNGEV